MPTRVCTTLYTTWVYTLLLFPGYTSPPPSSVSARLLTMGAGRGGEREPWAQEERTAWVRATLRRGIFYSMRGVGNSAQRSLGCSTGENGKIG